MRNFFAFFLLLFCSVSFHAQAQTGKQKDTVNTTDYTSYDTVIPKDTFVDTVHHIVQDTTHHELTEEAKADRVKAEALKKWIRTQIANLSSRSMHGRGYVKGGKDTAAKYILKKFMELKLKTVTPGGPWAQGFAFPVNTFPANMYFNLNGDSLEAGVDFLIDPASPSFTGDNLKIKVIDLDDVKDTAKWSQTLAGFDVGYMYCFEHLDSFCAKVLNISKRKFPALLPKGCFMIPEDGKLTWSVSRDQIAATVFYVDREIMPKKLKKADIDVKAVLVQRERNDNIIAALPGEVADSYIVFTAHYDHLGMMGDTAYFPGASDNASGVAMMLYLASYFAKHPQHYSVLFIAFAGEEAALMGSEFYVAHPFVPLSNIKFLTNIDIMGDATNGVTVVNATKFPDQFALLQQINEKGKYLPKINSRGPAANSDHYYFTEAGVPSFFIYSDGGKGYYHDIFDKAHELSLNHIDDFAKLMIEFAKEIK